MLPTRGQAAAVQAAVAVPWEHREVGSVRYRCGQNWSCQGRLSGKVMETRAKQSEGGGGGETEHMREAGKEITFWGKTKAKQITIWLFLFTTYLECLLRYCVFRKAKAFLI